MSAKKYYLIGLLFLLCVLGACKKKNRNIPISADLKKYFSYKPGTYWIYKDSVNGQIDSFAVLSNTFGTASSTYEVADQEIDNIAAFKKNILFDSIYCKWTLVKDAVGFQINYQVPISYPLFTYPFQQGNNSNNGCTISNIFNTFSFNGSNYNTVAEVHQTGQNLGILGLYNYEDVYFIGIEAGIIKMRFNHSFTRNVWELQRYKIVH